MRAEKGEKGFEKDLEWFTRVKNRERTERELWRQGIISEAKAMKIHEKIYFDTETYEYYEQKDNPDEKPKIIPYLIGTYKDGKKFTGGFKNNSENYKYYLGENAAIEFLNDLLDEDNYFAESCRHLIAFNIDYDFHVIRPWIVMGDFNVGIKYRMADDKKFLFGEIYWNKLTTTGNLSKRCKKLRFVDLWRWDMSKSLEKYMGYINELIYDEKTGEIRKVLQNDKLVDDEISSRLKQLCDNLDFTKETFKKLSIDYKKVNLHKVGNDYYYWRSKEDWINEEMPVKLDLESELKYLEIDVKSLIVIEKEQELFRYNAKKILGLTFTIDECYAISIPGFGKYLCEEYEKKYMTETYRMGTSPIDYEAQESSYFGAFVGGNKDITYLDEQIFKQMYPKKSFFDKEGNPRIKSYDVNSMYPWAMSTGLPVGVVRDLKPSKPHVVWYEIHFKSFIERDLPKKDKQKGLAGRVYKWKEKYSCLNNCFFGDSFEVGIVPGHHPTNKVYVLKELWELFDQMCDHTGKIVATRYQVKSFELREFVEKLYEIKADRENKEPKTKKETIKLILNSLYGKMAERFKETNIQWVYNVRNFIVGNPHYKELLEKNNISIPNDLTDKRQYPANFKTKISPFIDFQKDEGFCITPNVSHRYTERLDEERETILAGAYITAKSRHKLLSAVKGEIDNGNIVLYCDTDSIKILELKKPKFKCHNKDLGAWKNEGSFTHFGHPNRLKKYYMHNNLIEYTKDTEKKCWMVKTSGVPVKYLRTSEGLFDLEMIKTIYNPENRVLIKNCKSSPFRNEWYQTVIRYVDFKFIFDDPEAEPTHILDKGVLTKCQ